MKSPPKEEPGAGEQKLTTAEAADLTSHERTIKTTHRSFIACGRALEAIRDGRLYRALFGTFEEYCQKRWGWTRQWANRLIQDSHPENVTKSKQTLPQTVTVSQANVTGLETEVSKSVTKIDQPEEGPIIELDETGYPVPEPAMKYWERKSEMESLLGLISQTRSAIRKQNQDDRIFVELRIREVVAILNEAYREFFRAVPYAVCTTCQGQAPDTCRLCQGRGVISKHLYTVCVPAEIKEIRKKAAKKSA